MSRSRRNAVLHELSRPVPAEGRFDEAELSDLPAPARRLIARALFPDAPLARTLLVDMEGEIKLKDWMPFQARQVFRAGEGFAWAARVGRFPITFSGGDFYSKGEADLDFRIWGLIPVARGSGPDIARSARGRLAIETVSWIPQSLLPSVGAIWSPLDDKRAVVSVPIDGHRDEITVTVDVEGLLRDARMMRWGDPDMDHFEEVPFGGGFDEWGTFEGVTIPTSGRVGWWWGTDRQDSGEFFRGRLLEVRYPVSALSREPG